MKHKMLIFTFFLQFALIAVMFINASFPVFFGEEVKVRAYGYDPRDLLAGNFVELDYGLKMDDKEFLKTNEVFVLLENDNGIFKFGKKILKKPKDGLFIKAKIANKYGSRLKIGAEKYFATKNRALEIEEKLRDVPDDADGFSAIATLRVFNGRARIVDLEIAGEGKAD